MKAKSSLLLAGLLLALSAGAQDDVLVCQRAADGSCVWTQAAPAPAPQPPEDLSSPVPQEDLVPLAPTSPSMATPAPSALTPLTAADVEPMEMDPLLNYPGKCARTAGRARYRFAAALQTGNINHVIATYDWKDRSEAEAEPLIQKLEQVPIAGSWVYSGGQSWHWIANNQIFGFDMHEVDGCWFVRFAAPRVYRPAPSLDNEPVAPSPAPEPQQEQEGIYRF